MIVDIDTVTLEPMIPGGGIKLRSGWHNLSVQYLVAAKDPHPKDMAGSTQSVFFHAVEQCIAA